MCHAWFLKRRINEDSLPPYTWTVYLSCAPREGDVLYLLSRMGRPRRLLSCLRLRAKPIWFRLLAGRHKESVLLRILDNLFSITLRLKRRKRSRLIHLDSH